LGLEGVTQVGASLVGVEVGVKMVVLHWLLCFRKQERFCDFLQKDQIAI
jgi:hypothetical protein